MIPCALGFLLFGIALAVGLKLLPRPQTPQDASEQALVERAPDAEDAALLRFAGSLAEKERFFLRMGLARPAFVRAADTLQIFSASLRTPLFRMPVLVGVYCQQRPVKAELLQLFWEEVNSRSEIVAGLVLTLGEFGPEARELMRLVRLFPIEGPRLARLLRDPTASDEENPVPEQPVRIRAAGVILARRSPAGVQLLLLKNARHNTWGFPKGHLDPGEDALAGALRELQEEVGWAPTAVVPEFCSRSRYRLPASAGSVAGQTKEVVYYLSFVPEHWQVELSPEHVEFSWQSVAETRERVGFPSTQAVVEAVAAFLEESET